MSTPRNAVLAAFNTGDTPTEAQFANWINLCKFGVTQTRAQIQALIAATNLDTNTIYNLTGGPSSNVLIVFPTAANAISDAAINLTTGEFGDYDITGNTFTAQGGGGGNPDAITIQARNNNASPITRGQLVYAVPGTGSQLNVDLARANSASTSNVIGMVSAASINAGAVGQITLFGLVTQLDTNATTEGSVLYLSAATAGARTDTVPAAPNYEVRIGVVDIQSTTVGKVVFHPSEPLSQQVILSEPAAPTTDAVIREMRQGLTTFNGVPGASQDNTQGYIANRSRVVDYNTQIEYLCTDDTTGAAVWSFKRVYRALLTQTGTDAPTAIILENTLGEVPTFNYVGVGTYELEVSANIFLETKTFFFSSQIDGAQSQGGGNPEYTYLRASDNVFFIATGGSDDVLVNAPIEITVYS